MSDDDFDYADAAVRVLRAAGGPMTKEDFWRNLMLDSTGLPETDRDSYCTGPFEPGPSPHNMVKLKITAAISVKSDMGLDEAPADRQLQVYGAEVFRGGAGYWLREWGPLPDDEKRRRRELAGRHAATASQAPRPAQKVTVRNATAEDKGACYIATAVYGSYDAPQVRVLRAFRDDTLAGSAAGRAFVRLYYAVSPAAARRFGPGSPFGRATRPVLDAVVRRLE